MPRLWNKAISMMLRATFREPMLRLWKKTLFCLLCAIFTASCGFIDLRPIGLVIEPDTDALLPDAFSPVILKFDTEMIKKDAEGILQVSSDLGVTNGDRRWTDNDLYFTPTAGWTAGVRYTLSLTGTVRSADGRDLRIEKYVSFYAVNKNAHALLIWHSPSIGESVGANDLIPEFHFSCPMDRLTTESALVIDGIGNKIFEWSADDTILKVIPEKTLSPWVLLQWNLRDTARSADGTPLAGAYSGHFTTDLDQTLPVVTDVFPVLYSDGRWFPTGADIKTGLGIGQGIAVSFNKPMSENVLNSLRFDPPLSGKAEFLSDNSIVYNFTRNFEPETEYTLTVSSDAKDTSGLKTGSEHRVSFTPDIPVLNVISFTADREINNFTSQRIILPVQIESGTGGLFFTIYFSLPFSLAEKQNTPQRIVLSPFFPGILPPAALQYAGWISSDRLTMRWEGLTAGDNEIPHYYKLLIPGGRSGINSDTGIYMRNDLVIYLEAVR